MAHEGNVIVCKVGRWNLSRWQKKFASHLKQENVQYAIREIYLQMTEKYVPYKTGALTKSGRVLKNGIYWGYNKKHPKYAIYPYYGITKGDKPMSYNKRFHPLARSYWDEAVFENEMDGFKKRVTRRLKDIAREERW